MSVSSMSPQYSECSSLQNVSSLSFKVKSSTVSGRLVSIFTLFGLHLVLGGESMASMPTVHLRSQISQQETISWEEQCAQQEGSHSVGVVCSNWCEISIN